MRYKIDFSSQIDRITPYFFRKSGQDRLIMDDLCSLNSNINNLTRNKHFLFDGS